MEKVKSTDLNNPIDHILAAEREAEARILDCRERNEERVDKARRSARNILERAHRRITAIHVQCKKSVEARSEELWREAAFPDDDVSDAAAHSDYPKAAAERLAARLTGVGDDD